MPGERVYKELCVATLTPLEDKEYKRECFTNVSGSDFKDAIRAAGASAVTLLTDYLKDPTKKLQPLRTVIWKEGETYVLRFLGQPLREEVRSENSQLRMPATVADATDP